MGHLSSVTGVGLLSTASTQQVENAAQSLVGLQERNGGAGVNRVKLPSSGHR